MKKTGQRGVTLIEVMVAVLIGAIGILGAAAMQLKSLKYTESSMFTSQASFYAYDILDRMRANSLPDSLLEYRLSNFDNPPGGTSLAAVDLADFVANVKELPGGNGTVSVSGSTVTVTINWSESRATGVSSDTNSFVVVTDVAVN